jgi:hypothetical protein
MQIPNANRYKNQHARPKSSEAFHSTNSYRPDQEPDTSFTCTDSQPEDNSHKKAVIAALIAIVGVIHLIMSP